MLKMEDVSSQVRDMQYAVRGPLVTKALKLEKQGRKILKCNIGNPQELGQQPLSYIRQVLAMVTSPDLIAAEIRDEAGRSAVGSDLRERAAEIIARTRTVGRYTESKGLEFVRQQVADYITKRDGIASDPDSIMLTDGASPAVKSALQMLIDSPRAGIMIPVPRYPLYSASITALGGQAVSYYLDEEQNWATSMGEMERSIEQARQDGIETKALAVINPGNPTGAVLSKSVVDDLVRFAQKYQLTILADEVYQTNIFGSNVFHSFAKAVVDLGADDITLFSFHSGSKSVGECGLRMGYMEIRNMPDEVLDEVVKIQSVSLCSNHIGQIATGLMLTPPQPGDESYEVYKKEYDHIQSELEAKAKIIYQGLNEIQGMSCAEIQGAMYAFPRIFLPEGKNDAEYCDQLLEETGILFVPGSGFGQVEGTWHFRTTLLPPKQDLPPMLEKLEEFHNKYTKG